MVNDSAGAVPFAITFDKAGRMLVAEAKESTVSTYKVRVDGTLEVVQKSLPNGQSTPCRLERAGDFFYGGNTGNSTVTGYRTNRQGRLALTNDVGVAAPPSVKSQGVIDLAATKDEKFLYAQNATSGTVDGFRVGRNGSLTKVGTTTGLPPSPSPAWRASPRCKEAATAAPAPRTVPVRGALACPYGTTRTVTATPARPIRAPISATAGGCSQHHAEPGRPGRGASARASNPPQVKRRTAPRTVTGSHSTRPATCGAVMPRLSNRMRSNRRGSLRDRSRPANRRRTSNRCPDANSTVRFFGITTTSQQSSCAHRELTSPRLLGCA